MKLLLIFRVQVPPETHAKAFEGRMQSLRALEIH
jgi:hypothetical protein